MNHTLYWRMRKVIISIVFFFKKQWYRHLERKDTQAYAKPLRLVVLKTILNQLFSSSLIVGFICLLDYIIINNTTIAPFNMDLYKELLLGGMGIAGVILGLYCANVASVFSAKYSNVPKRLAYDFQNDFITQSSIRQIIGYIVTCILMLMLCIAGIPVTWMSLCILAVLTVKTVVVFSVSGTRTYILSDTFRVGDTHTNRINNALRKLSKKTFITSDISFQHHIQKVCENDISVLFEIAKFNLDIPATQNSSMCEFMGNNLVLIGKYWQIKRGIPHNSKWFAEKATYPQWHTSSHTEISLAMRHGISISSTTKPNPWWFEDSLLAVNELCLDKLIKDADKTSIINYLNKLATLSSETIKAESNAYWIQHLESIQSKMVAFAENMHSANSNVEVELASIFDILASALVDILKSEHRMLVSLDIGKILDHACVIGNNYDADVRYYHFFNNNASDYLYRQIATENSIEKKRITPDWFIKQTIAKQMYIYLDELASSVENTINVYVRTGQHLHERELTDCVAVFFAHCFEVISSCEEIISSLDENLPILEQMHIEKCYTWKKVSLQSVKEALLTLNKSAPSILVKNCGSFALRNWEKREDKPDFLGLCYNHLCEHLIRSIEADDYVKFEAIYCDFFSLTHLYHEYVRTDMIKIKDPHQQSAVIYSATDPLVEFGKISGLATLWGEFKSDNRWRKLIQQTLAKFCEADSKGKQDVLKRIVQFVEARRSFRLGIANRDLIQQNWEQRIAHAMASSDLFRFEYRDFGRKALKTESELLGAFAEILFGDMLDLDNSEDIFFIVFVNQYLESDDKYKSRFGWEEDIDVASI